MKLSAPLKQHDAVRVEGHVASGFEAVRDAFIENFARRRELGGACCAYYRGEKVVDLWGGVRNKSTGEPWQEDTMVIVWSATKGLAAMTLALARQKPAWEPGTRQGYHALTLGFHEGELMRRIDPRHRSLGQFFQDEIATPPELGSYDECLRTNGVGFSLGFMKPGDVIRFGSDASFGSPGAGGAMGFADPTASIGYAYVTSQMGANLTGDPRDAALRDALYSSIPVAT